jgi:hypothetical protein
MCSPTALARRACGPPDPALLLLLRLRAAARPAPYGAASHRIGEMPNATASACTLLKIGAQVRVSVRRVGLSVSESYPYAALFRQVLLLAAEQPRAPRPRQHLQASGDKSGLAPEILRGFWRYGLF